ncbi:ATP-grasp domain-containing protein [Streptomyces odontomachi]|uniref:ATP-grasp domain-containing protein n=1 Tax=Streptomyces odontomachi TaxID=2944940 RepID=UPI002108A17F|nr:ATP-grasp domain-containing protein [Streptomyces sp. ODS25]
MTRPVAVVVDPFGSGSHLAPRFHRDGWQTVAVLTSTDLSPSMMASLDPDKYLKVIGPGVTAPEVYAELSDLPVAAVLPGTETGVEFADELGAAFGTAGNPAELRACRRDKAAMGERLHEVGVPAAEQFATADLDELLRWTEKHDRWPVIVKPRRSAASDGVSRCQDSDDVRAAFHRIVGRRSWLGATNDSVLAQEFLSGQQYLVNSVSVHGHHYIGEIWQFDSVYDGPHQIYDRQWLLAPHGTVQDQIVQYVRQVLSALQIRYGAAHTEVMLTERGPRLIETAARTTGFIQQDALNAAVGHHHISLTVDAYVAPHRILERPPRYTPRKSLGIVALRSPVDGQIPDSPALQRLLSLPTFAGIMGGTLEPGRTVSRTRDLPSSPGLVYLLADSADELRQAGDTIREIEATGLYQP